MAVKVQCLLAGTLIQLTIQICPVANYFSELIFTTVMPWLKETSLKRKNRCDFLKRRGSASLAADLRTCCLRGRWHSHLSSFLSVSLFALDFSCDICRCLYDPATAFHRTTIPVPSPHFQFCCHQTFPCASFDSHLAT